ncbi:MAG: ABC transporter ATP-binding protein [Syntrophaceae bacterium]
MLRLTNVNAYYGALHILKNVSLHVGPSEIVVVFGANGSGKSTLLKTIAGILPIRGGEIILDQKALAAHDPRDAIRQGVALVPEDRGLFRSLTVRENITLALAHRKFRLGPREKALVQESLSIFPALAERQHQLAGTLSGGEQQMLAIARALTTRPRLLLLDELSSGLAPAIIKMLLERLRSLRAQQGTAILLVEQNGRLALEIAERGYVMETGKVVFSGSATDLKDNPEIVRAYLGQAGGRDVFRTH